MITPIVIVVTYVIDRLFNYFITDSALKLIRTIPFCEDYQRINIYLIIFIITICYDIFINKY